MASSLAIPSVTEDDLRAFHAKHFLGLAPPSTFIAAAETWPNEEEAVVDENEEDYDDDEDEENDDYYDYGLGYYPDGVKRTLTDAQIAMFRHSEIQSILRDLRYKRECNGSPTPSTAVSQDTTMTSTSKSTESQAHTSKRKLQTDSAGCAGRNPRSKRQKNFQRRDERRAAEYGAEIKTQIERKEEYTNSEGTRTYRRIARDMDEQQAESIELDY